VTVLFFLHSFSRFFFGGEGESDGIDGIVGFNVPLDTIIGHFGDDFTGQ